MGPLLGVRDVNRLSLGLRGKVAPPASISRYTGGFCATNILPTACCGCFCAKTALAAIRLTKGFALRALRERACREQIVLTDDHVTNRNGAWSVSPAIARRPASNSTERPRPVPVIGFRASAAAVVGRAGSVKIP